MEEEARRKPPEQIYDEMLLPALALANRDRENEALPPEDARDLFRELRRIIEDVPAQQCPAAEEGKEAIGNGRGTRDSKWRGVILGCPAEDDADELVLEMLRQLIEPCEVRLDVLSAKALAAEVLERVGQEEPAVVCIATLPPNGLSNVRYLCKRLRARFPELKIVACRLGRIENVEKARQRLLAAGADLVTMSLLETRSQLLPLVQSAALSHPRPAKKSSQAAGQR
jgi:hypothetical protein